MSPNNRRVVQPDTSLVLTSFHIGLLPLHLDQVKRDHFHCYVLVHLNSSSCFFETWFHVCFITCLPTGGAVVLFGSEEQV